MALAYTAPTWTDGSGEGISASNLQAISNCIEGLVQGADKAVHNVQINGSVITLTYADGTSENFTAVDIKGISSIEKTSTSGLVDTYTITYSDGTTSTFTVTNGTVGVSPEVTITNIPGGHRVTITDADHPSGQSFDVMDGSGSGDMKAADYDSTQAVKTAGGIPDYVSSAVSTAVSGKLTGRVFGTATSADGTTVTFSGLDSTKGYALEWDIPDNYNDAPVSISNVARTGTSVTYTVDNATVGMSFRLIEIG